jgi:hypothetical protein
MTLAIVGIIDHTKDSKLKIQMNSIAPNGCSFSPSECHVCSSLPPPLQWQFLIWGHRPSRDLMSDMEPVLYKHTETHHCYVPVPSHRFP